jgi:threonine synthase
MVKMSAEVMFLDGSYEDCVTHSSKQADANSWYDANPGGSNTALQIMAYAQIAYEIYDQLRDAPKIVAVPVSNGTLLAGIFRGFSNLHKRGKTSRIPVMLAATSTRKNPIIYSARKGLRECIDLVPEKIRETSTNEPLINWHSFDGDEALYAINESNGEAFDISDSKMQDMSRSLNKKEGLNVLPASTAGLVALVQKNLETPYQPDRYVAILTGRK